MELERKINNKLSSLNPTNMKEMNMNSINIFDTNLRYKKNNINGFKVAYCKYITKGHHFNGMFLFKFLR